MRFKYFWRQRLFPNKKVVWLIGDVMQALIVVTEVGRHSCANFTTPRRGCCLSPNPSRRNKWSSTTCICLFVHTYIILVNMSRIEYNLWWLVKHNLPIYVYTHTSLPHEDSTHSGCIRWCVVRVCDSRTLQLPTAPWHHGMQSNQEAFLSFSLSIRLELVYPTCEVHECRNAIVSVAVFDIPVWSASSRSAGT